MAKKTNNKPPVNAATNPVAAPKAESKPAAAPKKSFSVTTKICLILAALSLLVYANTLRNGYVLDDNVVTIKNSIVTQGFKGIPELMVTPRMKGVGYFKNDNYRPLTLSMFAAEYEIFGPNPAAGHFFNILFFAGCVVLLFLFLDKLFERKKTVVAFIAALLFAVHPIHTEVVANIKSRDEICCFFFGFLALNLFLEYAQKGKILFLLSGVVAYFLAFISKETVITFLFVVPVVFFLYRNDDKKRSIFITVGMLVGATAYLIIRNRVLSDYDTSTSAIEFIDNSLAKIGLPVATRFATAIYVLGMYLKLLVIPYPLVSDYAFDTIPFVTFGNVWVLLTTLAYLGIGGYGVYRLIKNRKDPWAFGMLFFLATLSLFMNLAFLMGSQIGERFLFFASAGFCIVAALAIEKWVIKSEISFDGLLKNKTALAVLVPICLIFSVLTFARNNDWKSNYTLYSADLPKVPNDSRMHFYLGDELAESQYALEKDTTKQKEILNESLVLLKKAIEIYPEYTDVYTELGKVYLMKMKYDSSIFNFKKAISMSPYQSIAANNLGTAYLRTGKYKDAIDAYKLAISINPGFASAYFNLGCCFIQAAQYDSAIMYLNTSLSMDPNNIMGYMQMGIAYYYMGKSEQAIPYVQKVLQADPNSVDGLNILGAIYLKMGKFNECIEVLKKAVSINPNYINAYTNMAHCYYQMKQYQATIDIVNKILTLNPGAVNEIPYIALSYKAMGNMEMALKYEAISRQYFRDFKL
ncbi:MAG: tetratricopeptide repeat protein [Flavipsychrobacter sp.]|nr:tetratricopeptide repeat protein [Flavipsychrobacter sp.]